MTFLKGVISELFGMFVDDGSLAIAILIWTAIAAGLQSMRVVDATFMGPVLFAGLAAILIENVVRRAR